MERFNCPNNLHQVFDSLQYELFYMTSFYIEIEEAQFEKSRVKDFFGREFWMLESAVKKEINRVRISHNSCLLLGGHG